MDWSLILLLMLTALSFASAYSWYKGDWRGGVTLLIGALVVGEIDQDIEIRRLRGRVEAMENTCEGGDVKQAD